MYESDNAWFKHTDYIPQPTKLHPLAFVMADKAAQLSYQMKYNTIAHIQPNLYEIIKEHEDSIKKATTVYELHKLLRFYKGKF
jgi:hypothetical protein